MGKGLAILLVVGLVFGSSFAYAKCPIKGVVRDNNNGQKGQILVHSGVVQGFFDDVGTWTDADLLKGEKGDTGEQGIQGIQGIQGEQGVAGNNANVTHRYTDGAENQIANYGYNDFYTENAFKNNLINEGYSRVYDFDNPNLDLTEVGYFGKVANPNNYDKDYVLTSEYEKYSSQGQDVRITNNAGDISNNATDIDNNADEIIRVEDESKDRDTVLDDRITANDQRDDKQDKKIKKNTRRSKKNRKLIKKETIQRKAGDKRLNKKINRKERQSISRDNKLGNRITKETKQRKQVDRWLNKKIRRNRRRIKQVDDKHTAWNEAQDAMLDDHEGRITDNTNRLNEHDGRISDLEETEVCIRGEVQFIREKNWTVGIYGKTDLRHPEINNEIGLNVIIGLGKSWTEKEMDKMQKKLDKLSNMVEKGIQYKTGQDIQIKKVKTDTGYRFSIDKETTAKMTKKF